MNIVFIFQIRIIHETNNEAVAVRAGQKNNKVQDAVLGICNLCNVTAVQASRGSSTREHPRTGSESAACVQRNLYRAKHQQGSAQTWHVSAGGEQRIAAPAAFHGRYSLLQGRHRRFADAYKLRNMTKLGPGLP